MNDFISNLRPHLEDFIKFKNSLGIEYKTARSYLLSLDKYNYEHENEDIPTRKLVEGWIAQKSEKSVTQDRSWISCIKEFGRFLKSTGYDDAYILSDKYRIQKYRADVYLMSNKEIQLFFEACDNSVYTSVSKINPLVFPAFYRVMYCCGTRTIETRILRCENVHLDKGYIDILNSKSHTSRRLYISDELSDYLKEYDRQISRYYPNRDIFFPSFNGLVLSANTMSVKFKEFWEKAGLTLDVTPKPRAYDFRHHFACENIRRWHEENKDVHAMLPYLMRYMGHANLESTYYYIHLIPDYFEKYKESISTLEDLIPEVEPYEI